MAASDATWGFLGSGGTERACGAEQYEGFREKRMLAGPCSEEQQPQQPRWSLPRGRLMQIAAPIADHPPPMESLTFRIGD
jgi:hypothetical protein